MTGNNSKLRTDLKSSAYKLTRQGGQGRDYLALYANNQLKWILPKNPIVGIAALKGWEPYSLKARFKWSFFLIAYRFGVCCIFPNVFKFNAEFSIANPTADIIVDDLIPVTYIGELTDHQKSVSILMDGEILKPAAIVKYALKKGALAHIQREAFALRELQKIGVSNIPVLLGSTNQSVWQTAVPGSNSPMKITVQHISFLKALKLNGEYLSLPSLIDSITDKLKLRNHVSYTEQISNCLRLMRADLEFPIVGVHGDFAPWNIRVEKQGVNVFDWEGYIQEGIPLYDLCHFHYVQAYLFSSLDYVNELLNSKIIEEYLVSLNIDAHAKVLLIKLSIISMILSEDRNINNDYRLFLLDQLNELS